MPEAIFVKERHDYPPLGIPTDLPLELYKPEKTLSRFGSEIGLVVAVVPENKTRIKSGAIEVPMSCLEIPLDIEEKIKKMAREKGLIRN